MANNPAPPTQPFSDNNLINGKMNFDCSKVAAGRTCTPNAGVSKFTFHKGKTHRLRLINASAQALQRFTIDNHTMTVIANDFVPVVPYETNMVTLGIGQRTDVLVKANGESTDAVWMRSDISTKCSVANQPHALAAIYYEKADTHAAPKSTATPYSDEVCGNVSVLLSKFRPSSDFSRILLRKPFLTFHTRLHPTAHPLLNRSTSALVQIRPAAWNGT